MLPASAYSTGSMQRSCCGTEDRITSLGASNQWDAGRARSLTWRSGNRYMIRLLTLEPFVVVCLVIHDRRLNEVSGKRWRLDLPLEPGRLPWVLAGNGAILQGPS